MKDKNISNKQAKYTLRIDAQLLRALRYIAEYEGRSANREIEVLIKRYIAEFEKKNGKIELIGKFRGRRDNNVRYSHL